MNSEELEGTMHVHDHTTFRDRAKETLEILKRHKYIFEFPNTHILSYDIKAKFPSEWIEYINKISLETVHDLGLGIAEDNAPHSWKTLISTILNNAMDVTSWNTNELENNDHKIKMSDKKLKEVQCLSVATNKVFKTSESNVVVDIGTGLGYLAFKLYEDYKIPVLGIEGDETKYKLALKLQEQHYPHTIGSVFFINHFITDSSTSYIQEKLEQAFGNKIETNLKVTIAGLHACADLSANILKIFNNLSIACGLVVMPCCYHKMSETPINCRFTNFPISRTLNDICVEFEGFDFLKIPFLRLACQQASEAWKIKTVLDHENHARNLFYRCLIQKVADEENLKVSRRKRKTGFKENKKENFDFQHFLTNLDNSFAFTDVNSKCIPSDVLKTKLERLWEKSKNDLIFLEAFTALQTILQPMCEQLILFDRIEYLKEMGKCGLVVKIIRPEVTARNHALVCCKNINSFS